MIGPDTLPLEERADEPFWDWIDVGWFLAALVPCIVVSLLLTQGVAAIAGKAMGLAGRALLMQCIAYASIFAMLWFIVELRHARSVWPALRWPWKFGDEPQLLLAGFLLALAVAFGGAAIHAPRLDSPILKLMSDPIAALGVCLFGSTLGPAAEEAVFRGFLQPVLARRFGAWAAVVAISLAFAAMHGPQYSWSWKHLLLLAAASMCFGAVRVRWNSTGASTLVHAAYNFTFFIGYFAQSHFLQGRTLNPHG